MMIFLREEPRNLDKLIKVGRMRCDFCDGGLANTWQSTEVIEKESAEEIQKVVNVIMFEQLKSFDKLVDICDGRTGYEARTNIFHIGENFIYWIDIIPVTGDYNYYIHVYKK